MARKEINFIRPQEVYTPDTGEAKVRYRGYDGNLHDVELTENLAKDVAPMIEGKLLVATTWAELKALRDGGDLVAGTLYRITDYNCTTTQENTRSAGHQFDVIVLALSENKLAEEGWAMMNESNVYDVTFSDGVTKKCYIYKTGEGAYNIVNCDDLLGQSVDGMTDADWTINEENKTIIISEGAELSSIDSTIENLPYNYFQNSNLSAWKVWYCLDNDKSRFAWADDSVDEGSPANITTTSDVSGVRVRSTSDDVIQNNITYYAWSPTNGRGLEYTLSETPSVGDHIYKEGKGGDLDDLEGITVTSYTSPIQGTGLPNGRGVIYRLIDEWGNDVAYDFKNIQFELLIDDGYYEPQSQETAWVYGLNIWRASENIHQDASVIGNTLADDGSIIEGVFNNIIKSVIDSSFIEHVRYLIPKNIMLSVADAEDYYYGLNNNLILGGNMSVVADSNYIKLSDCYNVNVKNSNHIIAIQSLSNEITEESVQMYIGNKKVLTEE